MADWNHSSATIIRPYHSPYGSPHIRYFQESTCIATAVIKAGDVVSFDTIVTTGTRRIVRAPSSAGNSTNLLEVPTTPSIVGIALDNSTSDGSTTGLLADGAKGNSNIRQIGVALADGQTSFLGYLSSRGASAHVADSSLAGLQKSMTHDRALGRWFIDSTNSTVALFTVQIIDVPQDNIGDSNGPVIFKFLSSNVSAAVRLSPSV